MAKDVFYVGTSLALKSITAVQLITRINVNSYGKTHDKTQTVEVVYVGCGPGGDPSKSGTDS